jgi:hypothetical protein
VVEVAGDQQVAVAKFDRLTDAGLGQTVGAAGSFDGGVVCGLPFLGVFSSRVTY